MRNDSLLVFVEECVLLSVHAQQGDFAKLYLSPSLGAHEGFDHTKLLERACVSNSSGVGGGGGDATPPRRAAVTEVRGSVAHSLEVEELLKDVQ